MYKLKIETFAMNGAETMKIKCFILDTSHSILSQSSLKKGVSKAQKNNKWYNKTHYLSYKRRNPDGKSSIL